MNLRYAMPHLKRTSLLIFLTTALFSFGAEKKVDFNKDIRSLLSNRCYACHGPDDEDRKGKLRLDTREGALKALVPGKPSESELVHRLRLDVSDDDAMPPKGKGARFTPDELALIERWIEQDAPYATHWSYEKPVRSTPPKPSEKHGDWVQNEIDQFILARIESEGMSPSAEADRLVLARRLSLDLTGLPPSWDEAKTFADDTRSDAYSRYVDLLIAKPAFGERWARVWLDLARYADSAGYADDPARTIWGYRDYVIKSLNANKPFDQFTIEQIAGDLLPEPTPEQLVATAFHRNTLTNNEGGTNDEEFRNVAVVDRVNTTMAVWMGTTIDCAQCHTHKFDPLTHAEYFQLFAFFNQSEDADRRNESPRYDIWTEAQETQKLALASERDTLQAAFDKAPLDGELATWLAKATSEPAWTRLTPRSAKGKKMALKVDGNRVLATGDKAPNDTYTIQFDASAKPTAYTALRLEVPAEQKDNFVLSQISASWIPEGERAAKGRFVRVDLPGNGKMIHLAELQVFSGGKNIALKGKAKQSSTGFGGAVTRVNDGNTDGRFEKNSVTHTAIENNPWIEIDLGSEQPIENIVIWNRVGASLEQRLAGYQVSVLDAKRELVWEVEPKDVPEPKSAFSPSGVRSFPIKVAVASHEQKGFPAATTIAAKPNLKQGWAIAGGLGKTQHITAVLAAPLELSGGTIEVTLAQNSIHKEHLITHFSIDASTDPDVLETSRMPADVAALVRKETRSAAETKRVADYFRTIAPSLKGQRDKLAQLDKQLTGLKPATSVPIMRNRPMDQRRETHIQIRGNYLSKGDEVSEGVPAVFHKLEARNTEPEAIPDRLDLAKWLVHEDNPLTARVIANRHWEQLFGIGIVETSEEFGSQGELPSHPELLDWLAVDLRDNGWDIKRFIKQLVSSAAYRQRSNTNPELQERDPWNRLVARGPRFRVSAEMVRDQALAVSGLLSSKMYGPPVKPPQPNSGLKAAFGSATDWQTSMGEDKYRRGLYTTWRRSNPYPSMATFDAPDRQICTVRRGRTNTPLQALVTLNDPVYIEAAQSLAKRMQAAGSTGEEHISFGFRESLTREPSEAETRRLVTLYDEVFAEYKTKPAEAKQLGGDGDGAGPEQAAWTVVANVLLNLDEIFMKR